MTQVASNIFRMIPWRSFAGNCMTAGILAVPLAGILEAFKNFNPMGGGPQNPESITGFATKWVVITTITAAISTIVKGIFA